MLARPRVRRCVGAAPRLVPLLLEDTMERRPIAEAALAGPLESRCVSDCCRATILCDLARRPLGKVDLDLAVCGLQLVSRVLGRMRGGCKSFAAVGPLGAGRGASATPSVPLSVGLPWLSRHAP